MTAIVANNGTVSFPDQEVYGIGRVRIMKDFAVAARTLDTPRHIREASLALVFKIGDQSSALALQRGLGRLVYSQKAAESHNGLSPGRGVKLLPLIPHNSINYPP